VRCSIGRIITDEYWLLGCGVKNVIKTFVNRGRYGKGIIYCKNAIKPAELEKIVNYVISLQSTIPKKQKVSQR
jgi:cytochrome c oxidase cbb3-type subunit 3